MLLSYDFYLVEVWNRHPEPGPTFKSCRVGGAIPQCQRRYGILFQIQAHGIIDGIGLRIAPPALYVEVVNRQAAADR